MTQSAQLTRVIRAINEGDPEAAAELLPLVYTELRKLARSLMAKTPPGNTFQTTALVMRLTCVWSASKIPGGTAGDTSSARRPRPCDRSWSIKLGGKPAQSTEEDAGEPKPAIGSWRLTRLRPISWRSTRHRAPGAGRTTESQDRDVALLCRTERRRDCIRARPLVEHDTARMAFREGASLHPAFGWRYGWA